jgi:hypothetical protein
MRDYWMSKLFFDLQNPALAADFLAAPEKVLDLYALDPEVRQKVLERDVTYLAERTNAYLLRYFFFTVGMKDPEFIEKLRDG